MKAKWINFTTLSVSPIAIATIAIASVSFNQKHLIINQNPVDPEDQFDLNWKPTQPSIIQIPAALTNQPFQTIVEQMVANQQLSINWQFDLVSPYQLLNQYQNDYQELSKAFSFNYFDPDLKQWTSDHNWKFAITNIDRLNQNQIDLIFEIYQYDQNHYATGQIATIKQSFSLQNQLADPATYYQAVLKAIQLVPNHDVSNISFATLLQNIHYPRDFQALWMVPPIIGANLAITLPSQLISDQITYNLTINNQYRLNNQVYQLLPNINYQFAFINDDDLDQLASFSQDWNQLNYLTIINQQIANQQLILDQKMDKIKTKIFDLSAFTNIKFSPTFQFPTALNTLKFRPQMRQLSVPQQPANLIYNQNVVLPEQKDLEILNQWYDYFRLNKNNLLNKNFNYQDLKTLFFADFPIYDQASQTLNLEILQQWAKTTQQTNKNLGREILNSITNTFNVKTLVLPINYRNDRNWKWAWNYETKDLNFKTLKTIENLKFGSQTYPNRVYESFSASDLDPFVKILPNQFALKTITIPPSVVVFDHSYYRKQTNIAKLLLAGVKISRQLDDKIIALAKDNLDLDQNLPLELINDNQKQPLKYYGANAIFNQFDPQSNQQLAKQVQSVSQTFSNFNNISSFFIELKKNLGWMFDKPLVFPVNGQNANWVFEWTELKENYQFQSQYLAIPKLIKPIDLIIKTTNQRDQNLLYQAISGFDDQVLQNQWQFAIAAYRFNLMNFNLIKFNNQNPNPSYLQNGILDLKQYLAQFNPLDASTSLINHQDQVQTIKVDPQIKAIPAAAFAGISFKNDVTIDLSNVEEINDYAFFNSNLKIKNLNFTNLKKLGILSLANLNTGFDQVNFSQNQILTTIPAGAFANTKVTNLKLSDQINEIDGGAFQSTQLNFNLDQPLDLKAVKSLGFNAFSNNPNLKKVINYQLETLIPAFDRVAITDFDFSKIKQINTNFNTPIDQIAWDQWLISQTWDHFQLTTLDLSSWIPDPTIKTYYWNLPSVKTIIFNPQIANINLNFQIKGLKNLTKIVNWNHVLNPQLVFPNHPNLEIVHHNNAQISANTIGYDQNSATLDWSFLDPWILLTNPIPEIDDFASKQYINKIITIYYQSQLYFAQNPQAPIKKLIIPQNWFTKHSNNINIFKGLDLIKLPQISNLAINNKTIIYNDLQPNAQAMQSINRFFQQQTISQIDPLFFANFYVIPNHIFNNVNFTNNQVVNLFNPISVGQNAFWNSSLKQFIGLDQPKNFGDRYGQIANQAFNPDTKLTIGKQYQWTSASFGLPLGQYPPNVEGFNRLPNDPTLGGFYNPIKQILDFRNLGLISDDKSLKTLLDLIKFQLKDVRLKALYLPKWSAITNVWLNGWNRIENLIIDPMTTKFGGGDGDPNRNCFANLPQLIHTNIIIDESGFWNETV